MSEMKITVQDIIDSRIVSLEAKICDLKGENKVLKDNCKQYRKKVFHLESKIKELTKWDNYRKKK